MERIRKYRKEIVAVAACLAALSVCFAVYCVNDPFSEWYECVIELCDLLLFCVIGSVFVFRWFGDWKAAGSRQTESDASPLSLPDTKVSLQTDAVIVLSVLGVHLLRVLLAYIWALVLEEFGGTPIDALWYWRGSDTPHYLDIAEHWYADYNNMGTVWRLVFLPFYSVLIRLVRFLIPDWFYAGLFVSWGCSAAAGCVLYRVALLDGDRQFAARAVKYFCILPAALFYTSALSESTFLLLSLLCILWTRKKKWLLACLAGGLAAFTRSVGIMLLVPVCYEWLTALIGSAKAERRKTALWGFALLLVPMGFGAYLVINLIETGDPFAFTIYQQQNWDQRLGWFFHSVRYQLNYLLDWMEVGKRQDAIGLWAANLIAQFGALGLMTVAVRKLRPSYVAYFLVYFAVAMGATWLLSAPRYLLVLFPVLLALADCTENRRIDAGMTAGCLLLGQVYLVAFLLKCDVY